jgi:hypothetical protein
MELVRFSDVNAKGKLDFCTHLNKSRLLTFSSGTIVAIYVCFLFHRLLLFAFAVRKSCYVGIVGGVIGTVDTNNKRIIIGCGINKIYESNNSAAKPPV